MPPPFDPIGLSSSTIIPNQVTFVSFPDGFTIGPPEPIDFSNPFPSINFPPEIGIDYYDYLFANVDGVLSPAPVFHATNYAVCYYLQRPWDASTGGGGGAAPWNVFVYDAITGEYLSPTAPLLTAEPAFEGTVGPYAVGHSGSSALPSPVDCLQVSGTLVGIDIGVTVIAARTGDNDQPAAPKPNTTYTPNFKWFVIPFGLIADYTIGAPSAPNAPLGGTIVLRGGSGGIVIGVYSLTSAPDCAKLYNLLNGLLKFRSQLEAQIAAAIAQDPKSSWPTTVWPLEAQLSTLNAEISALETQLSQFGCPGYAAS